MARLKAACCAAPFLVSVALADQPRPTLPDGCLPEAGAVGQALEGTLRAAELRAGDGVCIARSIFICRRMAALPGDGVRQMRFWAVSEKPDRWQRRRGHLVDAATGAWTARDLVGIGEAIAAPALARPACFPALMQAERDARARELGIWKTERVRSAHRPRALASRIGRYTLVAGRVLAGETRSTLYLNFGRRWSRDFTATIAIKNGCIHSRRG
ncbi:MAG: hypothetical protein HPM95_11550 [Alphaproteobacteria bacterium]|nr:hypothetical protein [Alphaproteobacteria bacterium]